MLKSAGLVTLAVFAATLSACAGTSAPETSEKAPAAVRVSDPVATLAGTWAFDLEASDVAGPVRQDCASKSGGDAAKQAACWNEIAAEAKLEKVRFSKPSEGGRAVWTSFGLEGKREVVFVEAPVELTADGAGHLLAKVAGKATGRHADEFEKSNLNTTFRIDVVDDHTIAIDASKKGRLVYSKERL